ncbi:hypothetical protein ACFOZ7_16775 [Natribaculum luteum]|uniref:Uncharacterized protein n=1 Tax=Natribaculum luteum TaxID=1586232 RepID=A0ABD5P2X4_9EURY|nr:hypothetical protein [Natribaculum luteum]
MNATASLDVAVALAQQGPKLIVTLVAGFMLLLSVAFLVFVAIGPYLSPKWAAEFDSGNGESQYGYETDGIDDQSESSEPDADPQ